MLSAAVASSRTVVVAPGRISTWRRSSKPSSVLLNVMSCRPAAIITREAALDPTMSAAFGDLDGESPTALKGIRR